MVEIIVIVNRMNEKFDIEFAIFFGSADVLNAHGKPPHSNVRCKNNVSRKMKNKIHFFYLEVKYAFLFIILTIKVPLRLNDSRVKMNVTEITDTVDSSIDSFVV